MTFCISFVLQPISQSSVHVCIYSKLVVIFLYLLQTVRAPYTFVAYGRVYTNSSFVIDPDLSNNQNITVSNVTFYCILLFYTERKTTQLHFFYLVWVTSF